MARLAILTLFMGATRNRVLQCQAPRTIAEILATAGRTTARLTRKLEAICDRIDRRKTVALQADKNAARTLDYLHSLI